METRVFDVSSKEGCRFIREAGLTLRRGGLVAFPTETVYGLGADALNVQAVNRIFEVKGRPLDNPLIIHISEPEQLNTLVTGVTGKVLLLAERFWPGPLTLVLSRRENVPSFVSAGLPTVAVRIPGHPVALALIKEAGTPVAAPSANISGKPSPTEAAHVIEDLAGKIDVVLDGGSCRVGVESTVLDLSGMEPAILRPGGVTREELEQCLERPVKLEGADGRHTPRSPGMKYRHYAPGAPLHLFSGPVERARNRMEETCRRLLDQGKKVGVLCAFENRHAFPGAVVQHLGASGDPEEASSCLYRTLRSFDRLGVDIILAESYNERGMGLALMNRLRKAAHTIVKVE